MFRPGESKDTCHPLPSYNIASAELLLRQPVEQQALAKGPTRYSQIPGESPTRPSLISRVRSRTDPWTYGTPGTRQAL